MIRKIQKWLDIGDGWTAQVNLNYDNDTKEVLMEEVVCSHKDIDYKSSKPQASQNAQSPNSSSNKDCYNNKCLWNIDNECMNKKLYTECDKVKRSPS